MLTKLKSISSSLLVCLILAACSLPAAVSGSLSADAQAGGPRIQTRLVYAGADATPTATPFQPLQPTPAYEPTRIPTATPEPVVIEPPEIEPPVEFQPGAYYQRPEDQVNVLLMGSDQRIGDPSFRTDTIVLATLNPSMGTVTLTSFPRDLYLYIPGWTTSRINTIFNLGGFQLLQQTFLYNFGIQVDHYVMVNFSAFTRTIDELGGIDVTVAVELKDHRDQMGKYVVEPGVNTMDGETALWYVRSRYTTSDFDRGRRQQEVLKGLFNQLMSLDAVTRAPELYEIYQDSVLTDLRLRDITPLLPMALRVYSAESIYNFYIGPAQTARYIVPGSGADVLLPIQYAVMDVIYQAVGVP